MIALTACPKRPVPEIRPVPIDATIDSAPIVEEMLKREAAVQSLRGLARIRLESPEGKGSFSEAITAERDAFLRLETIGIFGQRLGLLATDGGRLAFFAPRENRYYSGAATGRNLSRFMPFHLELPELVGLLLGDTGVAEAARTSAGYSASRKELVLHLFGDGGRLVSVVLLDSSGRRTTRLDRYDGAETAVVSITYGDHAPVDGAEGIEFPRRIELRLPREQTLLDIEFRKVRLNGTVDHDLFRLSPPPGVEIVNLDA